MPRLVKIFFTGMLISFLGSLPLGTLNVAAMQISVTESVNQAILFSLGSLLAEVIYVRLSLVAMDWVRKQEKIIQDAGMGNGGYRISVGYSSFYVALHPKVEKNIFLSSTLPKFILGLVMSALNPVQIPFWFGWSTVLFTKKILLPQANHYNVYIIGIGIGTFIGNCVFIFGGRLMVDRLNTNQNILNWVIGSIFAITALIQLWRIMIKRKSINEKLDHPENITHGLEKKIH